MLPFYIASPLIYFSDALFESFAGFTTTGFSNLPKYEGAHKAIILWRSIIQWLGGMGILIFLIALFPISKTGELKIFFSDIQDVEYSPLHSRIANTARRLWTVYIIFTFIGIIALILAGLNWFEALCLAFSSVSTGGGVPYSGDISHLSITVKSIVGFLMLIAGANYFFIFQAFIKKKALKNEEFIFYVLLFVAVSSILVLFFSFTEKLSFVLIFETIFNSISFISTTGFYSNSAFNANYTFIWFIMFFLLFIGSSTGSTGGGVNVYRIVVLIKHTSNYFKSIIHPNAIFSTKLNNKVVDNTAIARIFAFFVLYIIVFFAGAFLLSLFGLAFNNAVGICASSLSNTGPGVFLINGYSNISQFDIFAKFTIILLMVIGRLEIFPFLLILSKSFWKP